jgi:hypothetical protein
MKKFLLLIVIAGLVQMLPAQTQRKVLIEEATNASCGPCASQNPAFNSLLNQNRDKLTAIKYHWYFPGYDPMHLHNVTENNARVSYYGINGVPTAVIDGVIPSGPGFGYPGGPHGFTQALINQYHAVPSPFEIDMHHYLSPTQDSVHVIMRIRAAQDFSGSIKAHMVVIEKLITFATPPGGNGETVFHDVMKKMLPNQLGTTLPSSWEEGDYLILRQSWKLANVYNINQLGVVGFIQENVTKTVHQAADSNAELFAAYYPNDAAVLSLKNVTHTNCSGNFSPVIEIANYGAEPLTSLEIVYQVNEEEPMVYNWAGNLNFLESEIVALPEIEFAVLDENVLDIVLQTVNGVADEYPKNNTVVHNYNIALATPTDLKLRIRLDSNPEEITWNVKNMAGEVVHSGGPYTTPNVIVNETMQIEELGCYLFTINDAGGDGLLPPGFFVFYFGSNTQIISGTTFGSQLQAQFDVGGTLNIDNPEAANAFSFYPNPVKENGVLELSLRESSDVEVVVLNLLGQVVKNPFTGKLPAGIHLVDVETSGLDAGLYLISSRIGEHRYSKKIAVIR